LTNEYMQGVCADGAAVPLGRRLVAALAALTAASLVCTVLQLCTVAVPAFLGTWREPVQRGLYGMIEIVLVPWLMYRILRAWSRAVDCGGRFWFQSMRMGGMAAVLAVLIGLICAMYPFSEWVQTMVPSPFDDSAPLLLLPAMAGIVVMGVVWLWFCDRPPRPRHAAPWAACAWFCTVAFGAAAATIQDTAAHRDMLSDIFATLAISLVVALASLGLYKLMRRVCLDSH
jgi:hypothetical protein